MFDMLGTKYRHNDRVVYPYRKGSQLVMRTGLIKTISGGCIYGQKSCLICDPVTLRVFIANGRVVKLTRLDNVVVVK